MHTHDIAKLNINQIKITNIKKRDFIPIKVERNRFKKILINDIIYCKAEGPYSVIKTISDEFTFSKCLKEIQLK